MTTCEIASVTPWVVLLGSSPLNSDLPDVMHRLGRAAIRQRLCLALSASGTLSEIQVAQLLDMTPAAVARVVKSAADELSTSSKPDSQNYPRAATAEERRLASAEPPPDRVLGWYRRRGQAGHSYWDGNTWHPWVPPQSSRTERAPSLDKQASVLPADA